MNLSPHMRVRGLAVVVVVAQLLALLNPDFLLPDFEERYGAGHARALLAGTAEGPWDLQYRPFCGGCVLVSVLGAGVFALLPPTMMAWKLVPVGFTALLAGVAASRLSARTATGFLLLLLFCPTSWLHLSLMAWGNHYEAGVMGTVALIVLGTGHRRRDVLDAGLALGVGLAIGWSGVPAVVTAGAWLLWQRRSRDLMWVIAGLLPVVVLVWLGQWWTTDMHPFVTIYTEGEALPDVRRLPHKLSTLLNPGTLGAIFGASWLGKAGRLLAIGWLSAVVFGLAARHERPGQLAVLGAGMWVTAYLLVPFELEGTEMMVDIRYCAPLLPLLMLAVADAVAGLWNHNRRLLAIGLLAGPLVPGLPSRTQVFTGRFPSLGLAHQQACDRRYFYEQAAPKLAPDVHRKGLDGYDPLVVEMHAQSLGRGAVHAVRTPAPPDRPSLREAWFAGAGAELAMTIDPDLSRELSRVSAASTWLSAVDGVHRTDQQAALRSLFWKWTAIELPWSAPQHTGRWRTTTMALAPLSEAERKAAWWAIGWHHGVHRPTPTGPVKQPPIRVPLDFWEGVGEGSGERFGPRSEVPDNLPEPSTEAWTRGQEAGRATGWR